MFEKKFLMSLLCLVAVLSLSATATRGANILFVSSMDVDAGHMVGDDMIKAFLEGLGHTVTYIDDNEDEAATEAAAIAADVVFISESVGSGNIKNEITEIGTPIIVSEPYAWDEMGLTMAGTDARNQIPVSVNITIVDAAHFMAGGYSGDVPVLTALPEPAVDLIPVATTGGDAVVIARASGDRQADADVYFVYEKGAALAAPPADGSPQVAADIRIGFFTASPIAEELLTVEGYALLGAAVDYALGLTGPPVEPAGANIVWVTETCDDDVDGIQDDQAWIDWLAAEGHTVDVRPDYWLELEDPNLPNKVDELNAADLVIVSRGATSGGYDDGNEPALWNSVTSPLITMNAYLVRTNRWLWMNTGTVEHADDIMLALDTTHPVFDGVTFEMDTMVIFLDNTVGTGLSTFPVGTDVGNGTLIAQRLSADGAWIAEWAAGVEFYAGSGQIAGGPRMLFVAGTQEDDVIPTPQGAWNLTADGEKMFRNAIAYMLPAAEEPPAAAGPVAHWQLDEGAGTIAADSSGNGLDGTLVGDPLWVAGMIGGALEFDGVDDNVDCGNPPILDFGTGDWTVSAWMNASAVPPGDVTIVGKGGDHSSEALPGVRYQVMLDESDYIHLVVDDDTDKFDPGGEIPVIDGQWHHVVMMRKDGTTLRLYVDGVEDMGVTNHGESTIPDTYDLSGTSKFNAYIGAINHAGNSTPDMVVLEKLFVGMIDDVRIYDHALSEAEVAALASGQ